MWLRGDRCSRHKVYNFHSGYIRVTNYTTYCGRKFVCSLRKQQRPIILPGSHKCQNIIPKPHVIWRTRRLAFRFRLFRTRSTSKSMFSISLTAAGERVSSISVSRSRTRDPFEKGRKADEFKSECAFYDLLKYLVCNSFPWGLESGWETLVISNHQHAHMLSAALSLGWNEGMMRVSFIVLLVKWCASVSNRPHLSFIVYKAAAAIRLIEMQKPKNKAKKYLEFLIHDDS